MEIQSTMYTGVSGGCALVLKHPARADPPKKKKRRKKKEREGKKDKESKAANDNNTKNM